MLLGVDLFSQSLPDLSWDPAIVNTGVITESTSYLLHLSRVFLVKRCVMLMAAVVDTAMLATLSLGSSMSLSP